MTKPLTFRYLLAGILLTFIVAIAIPEPSIGAPLRVALLGGLLLAAIRTRRRAGRLGTPAFVVTFALFAATLFASLFGTATALTVISQSATVVLTVAAIAILIQTLLGLGVVNGSAVNGVLCIYLLLALFFGALNEIFAATVPHYLQGADPANTSTMLYFSVITLTTVGYGDITPTTGLARAVASTEALTGQLYLVSVVAAVVSRYRPSGRA